ncbi:MAG: hypothetical protein ABNH00_06095 [Dokdonia sp.]|jgi:hypothetical protein
MKKYYFVLATIAACLLSSCNISERIIFNEDMSGQYQSSFDMSTMMKLTNQASPPDVEKENKVIDTVMVFSDILETYKDSISALGKEERAKLEKLKGMTLQMKMDEAAGIFEMNIKKDFSSFDQITFISNDLNDLFDVAKTQGGAADGGSPADQLMKADPVTYTFDGTVFRRVDIETLSEEDSSFNQKMIDEQATPTQADAEIEGQLQQVMQQFTEIMEKSTMTLEYTFPRKIISVSNSQATISNDGKTVTFAVDMQTLQEDKQLLKSFEVTLQNQ